jgi:hypothetical protein
MTYITSFPQRISIDVTSISKFHTCYAVIIDYRRLNISNFEMGVKDTESAVISRFIPYFIGRNLGQEEVNMGG